MGQASPYRARFIGGTLGRDDEDVACEGGEKYSGLVNVKNTCYVNSVIQALYFCTTFRKAAIRQLEEEDEPGSESLLTSLAELFAQIENQKKNVGCLTPRRFLTRLRKANDLFCNSEHHDAHEFMQFLLNDICDAAKKRARRRREQDRQEAIASGQGQSSGSNAGSPPTGSEELPEEEPRTWVQDILRGYLVNQMRCLCCETVTVRREEFLDLSVDIEQHTSIAACLRAFESTERLKSTNKFFCDTCGCLQEAEKRLRIYQLPSVLTLHLKRFKYQERLGRCCRLPYRVVFPLQLRIVEHRDKRRQRRGKGAAELAQAGVEEEAAQPPSRLFELRSVVVHIGRDSSYGHYVTVVRNGERCVLIDDDVVRKVEPEILRSFYGSAGSAGNHGSGGGSGDRHGQGGSFASDGGEPGYSVSTEGVPYYERAPEGTCCGYLLIYEAVDPPTTDHDTSATGSAADLGHVTEWISEDKNFSDSDSGESAEEHRTGHHGGRQHPNACDDGELTQAFEQRCIPGGQSRIPGLGASALAAALAGGGGTGAGASPKAASPASVASAAAADAAKGGRGDRAGTPPGIGALAWAAADAEGGRTPPTSGYGGHGVRTLGSVVPAAGGFGDTVSLSRVNVVTLPSPTGSLVGTLSGGGHLDTDRG